MTEPNIVQHVEEESGAQPLSAVERRDQYIGESLAAAAARSSTLTLTPEESDKLTAPFPDHCVRRGANGDQNLLYIPHIHIRQRLLQVIGPGQWSLVQLRCWPEAFTTAKNVEGVRLYAHRALLVRGVRVGEATDCGVYYPSNAKTTYADALKAAESACLVRIAGVDLGIGLQTWDKEWCERWKRGGGAQRYEPDPENGPNTTVYVSQTQIDAIRHLAKELGDPIKVIAAILHWAQVETIEDLPAEWYPKIIADLNRKVKEMKK